MPVVVKRCIYVPQAVKKCVDMRCCMPMVVKRCIVLQAVPWVCCKVLHANGCEEVHCVAGCSVGMLRGVACQWL